MEADSISKLKDAINPDFESALEAIAASKGRLVVSGIGKSAIIAKKIVATLNSTGTPAVFMHASDAIHGDLGMVQQDDIIIVIQELDYAFIDETSLKFITLTNLLGIPCNNTKNEYR